MAIAERRDAGTELTAEGVSNVAIGEICGVDEKTVRNDARSEKSEGESTAVNNLANLRDSSSEYSDPIDAVAALAADDKIRTTEKVTETRKKNEEKRKAELARPVATGLPENLHFGDFYELSRRIRDNSVELVFTDPPYDGKSVELYEKAARIEERTFAGKTPLKMEPRHKAISVC